MREVIFKGGVLGILILLCSCGEKAEIAQKNEGSKAAEVNAGPATPENLTCQVELHDPNLEVILDGSIKLQVLAKGFKIAEGPVWITSPPFLPISDPFNGDLKRPTQKANS